MERNMIRVAGGQEEKWTLIIDTSGRVDHLWQKERQTVRYEGNAVRF